MTDPEIRHLQRAVADLCDDLASQLRLCECVLKLESDLDLRRAAQSRFLSLTERLEKAA